MSILIAHLSDIHFKEPLTDNSILTKQDALARAIVCPYPEADALFIVISGDIAFSGRRTEYEYAARFIERLRTEVKRHSANLQIEVVACPGNHDCDISTEGAVRSIVADAFGKDGVYSPQVANNLSKAQREYFDFAEKYGRAKQLGEWKSAFHQIVFDVDKQKVVFSIINTALAFHGQSKPGSLVWPVETCIANASVAPSSVAVTVLHHPFGWFSPNVGRELRNGIDRISDIVLTGHEHVPDGYRKETSEGATVEYVEGGALQGDKAGESEWNLIEIDVTEGQFKLSRMIWEGSEFRVFGTDYPVSKKFIRNKLRTQTEFQLHSEWLRQLYDAEYGINHSAKDNLSLRDIFVWPQLKEVETADGNLVGGLDLCDYTTRHRRILLTGADKTGKSAFLRCLIEKFLANDHVPVYLNWEDVKEPSPEKLRRDIQRVFSRQYSSPRSEAYLTADKGKRVLLFDGLHKLRLGLKDRNKLCKFFDGFFGVVVISVAEELRYEELTNREGEERSELLEYRNLRL